MNNDEISKEIVITNENVNCVNFKVLDKMLSNINEIKNKEEFDVLYEKLKDGTDILKNETKKILSYLKELNKNYKDKKAIVDEKLFCYNTFLENSRICLNDYLIKNKVNILPDDYEKQIIKRKKIILDETKIPKQYFITKLDEEKIKAEIDMGNDIKGVTVDYEYSVKL